MTSHRLVFVLLVLLSFAASAAPPEVARAEIEHLLSHVRTSGCTFARNGTWYTGRRADEHLRSKYQALLERGANLATAESFIDQVATRSNVSGYPYLIRCGDNPAMESGTWFREELVSFRNRPR